MNLKPMDQAQFLNAVEYHLRRPLEPEERFFVARVYDPQVRDIVAQAVAETIPALDQTVLQAVAVL